MVILVVLVSFGLCLAGEQSSKAPSIAPELGHDGRYTINEAQNEYTKGETEKAEAILRDFVNDHYLIRFMLGNIVAERGDNQEAIVQYERSISLYPGFSGAWLNLGKLYYEEGRYGRAAECLLKGYEFSEQKNQTIRYQAAVCYMLAEEDQVAIGLLEELAALPDPDQSWVETLITVYLGNNMLPKALETIEHLIDNSQNRPYLWKLSAQVLLEIKDYDAALQALLIYSYGKELNAEESMLVGNLFNVINAPSAAAEYYRSSMNLGKDQLNTTNAERLAVTYLTAHETDQALEFLEMALTEIPSAQLWLFRGKILYDKGVYDDAGQSFRKSAELDPGDGQSYLMLAYCLIKLEDKDGSVAALMHAMDFPEQSMAAGEILKNIDLVWGQEE
ncbi:MAG: tetratricopeptide repeat protein [Proteobacteria bacterium]|nr:tetratricopeptide repeat protein [Pseudomonadota bacterium]MBU1687761.1 tetratricopeptide repeat protein [Pseudomonadota bacterium]